MTVVGEDSLYLASRSPRRADLLRLLGVKFRVVEVDVDESPIAQESPENHVRRTALAKAAAGRATLREDAVVVAADTAVSVDGLIFGKPRDRSHATEMLNVLSGRWHEVLTAVVLGGETDTLCRVVRSRVQFTILDAQTIEAYWQTGEPADKAGAYGIQGIGGALVKQIDGSYSAVVGLPLYETSTLLDEAGIGHALSGT
ncbi:MAG: nucleoside triphosphate pyrophosphatase [Pseudomonadota bacterium]|nr:nucleoside triphosphate pyrophosphatase [Pseudomonadota bacterium]